MLFSFRTRKAIPWEVVDSKSVEPVPMYDKDLEELDILRVGDADTCGTYVFDVKHFPKDLQFRNAVFFARQRLIEEIEKNGFNILLLESWKLTLYRRSKHYRVEVCYTARAACAMGKIPSPRPPPLIRVLDGYHLLF